MLQRDTFRSYQNSKSGKSHCREIFRYSVFVWDELLLANNGYASAESYKPNGMV